MATKVRTLCPGCGVVFAHVGTCRVLVTAAATRSARYSFVCPRCGVTVSKRASTDDVSVLVRGGVRAIVVPGEVLERAARPPAAAGRGMISAEELAELAADLEVTDDISIVAEWEGMQWR